MIRTIALALVLAAATPALAQEPPISRTERLRLYDRCVTMHGDRYAQQCAEMADPGGRIPLRDAHRRDQIERERSCLRDPATVIPRLCHDPIQRRP